MKIQTKITLLFFSVSTIGLIFFTASIFYFASAFSYEDFFARLEARVNLAAQINIFTDEKSATYQEIRNRYLEKLSEEKDYIITINRQNKDFKKPINLPDEFYNKLMTGEMARYNEGNHFYAGSFYKNKSADYIVIVSAADPYGFRELENLRKLLIIIFFISIALTYLAGMFLSYYIVKPIGTIIKRVKTISADNLNQRLEPLKGKDEIAELVLTFNNMLTRLETAFETQNNFVSNASHELRTPLTVITSETEYLLLRENLSDNIKTSAHNILTEAGKLEHILTSLIGLAQTGFDGKKQNWQKLRIDELIYDVKIAVEKIELTSKIELDFSSLPNNEENLYAEGNCNLLHLAFSNIVLNACKYSKNKPVTIKVTANNNNITIIVTDKGIGIPEHEQIHIFEPFFRASNTSNFEGYGIGLPLTLNIIRLHKGLIKIKSAENIGTEIQIILPVSTSG